MTLLLDSIVLMFTNSMNQTIYLKNIFQLSLYEDQNEWKHKLIPIEISKFESDKVIDLIIYKNRYVLIQKPNVFSGDHNKKPICRQCLNSFTSENMLIIHKPKRKKIHITIMKSSSKSHVCWKNHFHKNDFCFRIYADFEVDKEKYISGIGKRTLIFINQIQFSMDIV